MSSMYALSYEFLNIVSQLEELELDEQTFKDTMESYQVPLENKAADIIKFARNLETLAEVRKAEAKKLNELAVADTKRAERVLSYLDESMKLLGKKEMIAGPFVAKFKKGSKIVVVDETRLPDEYFIEQTVKKPMSKPELKSLLEIEGEIPGVQIVQNPDKLTIK